MAGRIKGACTLTYSTPIDPLLRELLAERFGANAPRPSAAVIPNFGGFAGFLDEKARAEFYRFWVYELLDEELVQGFPLEAAYPDRIPPTLSFTEAAVQRHRHEPKSNAYLFALNLMAVYALGWVPEKPLYPLGPWEATAERARKAREILVFDLFKERIDRVAKNVYWLPVEGHGKTPRWSVRDVGEKDVQQQAYILAMKLIGGETIEEMAKNVARAETWDRRHDPALDPLEFRLTQWLQEAHKLMPCNGPAAIVATDEQDVGTLISQEHLVVFPLAGSVALLMQPQGSGYSARTVYLTERVPPVDALRLVLIARRVKSDALESGEVTSGKSFWVHHDANLVTHLFGSRGRPGRLYQELRDWLRRKAGAEKSLVEFNDDCMGSSPPPSSTVSEEEFDRIAWKELLGGRVATPLNVAIIKARMVYRLSGRALRNHLADEGFQSPNADALRQRWRYLKKLLESRRGQ